MRRNYCTPQRNFAVILTVDVRIDPVDVERAAQRWDGLMREGPWEFRILCYSWDDHLRRQRRILEALLGEEETLERWMAKSAAMAAFGRALAERDDAEGDDDILRPLVQHLGPEDRAYFEAVIARDAFGLSIVPITEAISTQVVSVTAVARHSPPKEQGALVARRFRG